MCMPDSSIIPINFNISLFDYFAHDCSTNKILVLYCTCICVVIVCLDKFELQCEKTSLLTKSNTNQPVQSQKKARSLKFQI